jgi:hypothetical protein
LLILVTLNKHFLIVSPSTETLQVENYAGVEEVYLLIVVALGRQ